MKAVTEFPGYLLTRALQTKKSLEGKTPEEVQAGLGEAFKYEGDKLNHFMRALDVMEKSPEGIRRVMVVTLAEGENAPSNSTKVDDFYYFADVPVLTGSKPGQKPEPKGRGDRGGKGGKGGKGQGRGPKESPWGLSPEEKAAKAAKKSEQGATKPTT